MSVILLTKVGDYLQRNVIIITLRAIHDASSSRCVSFETR